MKNTDKKQPPKAIGIVATEGFEQLVLSNFLPKILKTQYPKAKIYLFTLKNTAQHYACFDFDDVFVLGESLVQNTSKMIFLSKLKRIQLLLDLNTSHSVFYDFATPTVSARKFHGPLGPEFYFQFLNALQITPQSLNFKLKVSAKTYHRIAHELIDEGADIKNLTVISPDNYSENDFVNKVWRQFDALLIKPGRYKTVLISGWHLKNQMHSLDLNQVLVWDGIARPFDETLALISHAKNFIGNDGLWTHVARQSGIPTQAIYGPSKIPSQGFLNLQKNYFVNQAQLPCSPCQKDFNKYDFSCADAVCMKSHSPKRLTQIDV